MRRLERILKEVVTGLYYFGLFWCFYTTPWYVVAVYIIVGSIVRTALFAAN